MFTISIFRQQRYIAVMDIRFAEMSVRMFGDRPRTLNQGYQHFCKTNDHDFNMSAGHVGCSVQIGL
jgi:hypothetical protein